MAAKKRRLKIGQGLRKIFPITLLLILFSCKSPSEKIADEFKKIDEELQ